MASVSRYTNLPLNEEDVDDSIQHIEPPVPSRGRKFFAAASILLTVAALSAAAIVHVPSARESVSTMAFGAIKEVLKPSGELERRTGRPLNDGLFENLVRVHSSTTLELKSGKSALFFVNESPESSKMVQVNDVAASSTEHVFTETGKHVVHAVVEGSNGPITHEFKVTSKVIRVELRDLTVADRKNYFNALHTFQNLQQSDGVALYGKEYKSLEYLLRQHLYGAADKSCDHWHDDAGMLVHHIGITFQMELSMRLIDPRVASHYWDYTREAGKGVEWYDSDIFTDEWFGNNSPNTKEHALTKGRFAYTPVFSARDFSDVTNPYGLLRSPWNTNPTPYLLRSNTTFFNFADSATSFPTCSEFAATYGKTLAETIYALNGELHGPVHIMIGGHWDNKLEWKTLGEGMSLTDKFLLLSKWMWRLGFVRTPSTCSSDTEHTDCMATCPEGIIGKDITEEEAYTLLKNAGIFDLNPSDADLKTLLTASGLGWTDLLTELCHVGSPGDMFTSAAPQDPTFWPLHGNAERLVSLFRVLDTQGVLDFDQTWGYEHTTYLPSDTGMVCDWSEVSGELDMPTCTKGICAGHKEDDLLPFTDMLKGQGDTLLTNMELYTAVDPYSGELPYAYDSMTYWEACEGQSIVSQYNMDTYGSLTDSTSSYWDQFYNGIWGVM